jgi:hypothetical protein
MAILKEFISSEIKELQTDCEIVWVEINIAGTNMIIIGSYYRPPSDDGTSLNNLDESFNRLKRYHASNIWLGKLVEILTFVILIGLSHHSFPETRTKAT